MLSRLSNFSKENPSIHQNFSCEKFKKSNKMFANLCFRAGIARHDQQKTEQIEALSAALGVSARTVSRWLNGEQEPHPCAVRLLENMATGITQQGAWCGWRVCGDELISPANEKLNPDIVGRLWLWRNERNSMFHKIGRLENENRRLKSAVNVDAWDKIRSAAALLSDVASLAATG